MDPHRRPKACGGANGQQRSEFVETGVATKCKPEYAKDAIRFHKTDSRNWVSGTPTRLDAARVKENCFSLSFIAAPACQSWQWGATGMFCRYSGGLAPSPERGRAERPSGQARREQGLKSEGRNPPSEVAGRLHGPRKPEGRPKPEIRYPKRVRYGELRLTGAAFLRASDFGTGLADFRAPPRFRALAT